MSADAAADTVNNMNPADLMGEVLTTYVEALAEFGIKLVSIASYVRGLNCFLVWLECKGHITQA